MSEELNEVTPPANPAGGTPESEATELVDDLAALTADLQRLQAEYANYRKRVDRDRELAREQAIASVLTEMLPILDDLERARGHGELEGGFKAVADQLERLVARFGLERFGDPGVPFDPAIHEALTHSVSEDVETITAIEILQPGYRLKGRTLRPARVAVADPA